MEQEWRDVKRYEGLYEVSDQGNVFSVARTIENSSTASGFQKIGGYFVSLCAGGYKQQYLVVVLKKRGTSKMCLAHRLVAEAFVPGYFEGAQVNHIDGNKHNNTPANLEWCTPMENSRHHASYIKEHLGYKTHNFPDGRVSYNCRFTACGTRQAEKPYLVALAGRVRFSVYLLNRGRTTFFCSESNYHLWIFPHL